MGEGLAAVLSIVGIGGLVVGVVIWRLVAANRKGAAAQEKLNSLSEVSKRESEAQDKLTGPRLSWRAVLDRWRRRRLRDDDDRG